MISLSEKKLLYKEVMNGFARIVKRMLNEDASFLSDDYIPHPGDDAVDAFILDWIKYINIDRFPATTIQKAQVDYNEKSFEHSVWQYGPELMESLEDDLQSLRKLLGKVYGISTWQVEVRDFNNLGYDQAFIKYGYNSKEFIDIIVADINKNREVISNLMNNYGYMVIREIRQVKDNCVMVHMFYVKKDASPVTKEILSKFEYVYHMTPVGNVGRILEVGLMPKPRNGSARDNGIIYPPRIYMSTDLEILKKYKTTLALDHETEEFSIIRIETAKLYNGMQFYLDPLFGRPYIYTENSIFPNALSLVE